MIQMFSKSVLVTELHDGTFTVGADASCDIAITGGSPKFPKLVGKIHVNLPHIRIEIADGLGVGEQNLDVTGSAMNVKVSFILYFLRHPNDDFSAKTGSSFCNPGCRIANFLENQCHSCCRKVQLVSSVAQMDYYRFFGRPKNAGFLHFGWKSVVLSAEKNSDTSVSILFKDLSNDVETYSGGRKVNCKVDGDLADTASILLSVTLDFNKSFHLPCAIAIGTACPMVFVENYLGFRVEAGEILPLVK
ncbi:hypothetical protein HK100_006682 [Physocladia obscura]|uniref:Uncharacterized protein n=1 Tax=Physocladia obscura TaxID=109957 RepID=A0AAD5SVS7_9FUNG|nr:hypothetical protein HK100_006682 [Physocladia obscura]